MKQYQELKVGQTRLKNDEVRQNDIGPTSYECHGTMDTYLCPGRSPTRCVHWHGPRKIRPGQWKPVQLVGHKILQSDLIIAEFRREVAVD